MIEESFLRLQGWNFYLYDNIEMGYPGYYAVNPMLKTVVGRDGVFSYYSDRYPNPNAYKRKVRFEELPTTVIDQLNKNYLT